MNILRVFIKPDGRVVADVPMPPGANILHALPGIKADGCLFNDAVVVPWDSILWATIIVVPDPPAGAVVSHLKIVPAEKAKDPPG